MGESAPDLTRQDPVLRLVEGQKEACEFLRAQGQDSFAIAVERELAKLFVLSAASFFESRIVEHVTHMTESLQDPRVTTLVRLKAIKRQYHTYFDWDRRKLGPFKTMFGDEVTDELKKLTAQPEFEANLDAFLEIGQARNMLVHGNFATQSLSGTLEEWLVKYKRAHSFLESVATLLRPSERGAPVEPSAAQQGHAADRPQAAGG